MRHPGASGTSARITAGHHRRARCAALAAGVALLAASAGAAEVAGPAQAIDGDSLTVAGEEVRLHGIDAPEALQTCRVGEPTWRCGRAASETLAFLLQRGPVRCEFDQRDAYGRALATCFRDGRNLNALMVEVGMALAYRRYSEAYVDQEQRARDARRGLWDAEFEPPWAWREAHRGAPAECPVKGNVNRRGERIFHTPASPAYARLRLHPAEGDRCFDSAEAARAAGFRAPR